MSVVGARPQFIKAAPVHAALVDADVDHVIIHTGQHYDEDMSTRFFTELNLPEPAVDLGVSGGGNAEMIGRMLTLLPSVLGHLRPDTVVVYGDTNSAVAGAFAAASLGVRLAHIEAGLRSGNRRMAEERNRVVVDHLSDLLFCPTRAAVQQLEVEGITSGVHHTGDVMFDLAVAALDSPSSIVDELGLAPGAYAVVTVHRAETADDPDLLRRVLAYVEGELAGAEGVLVVHPRLRQAMLRDGIRPSLREITPLGYRDMAHLVASAACVYTDSGGLQKEAYFHRVPCVTLRAETEWPETVVAGWNRLWTDTYRERREIDDFGHGDAARQIVSLLLASPAGAPGSEA